MKSLIARMQVSENGFAFDPQTGSTFSLNRIGVKIMRCLREDKNLDQIANEIAAECGIGVSHVRRDVEDFVVSLKELGKQ